MISLSFLYHFPLLNFINFHFDLYYSFLYFGLDLLFFWLLKVDFNFFILAINFPLRIALASSHEIRNVVVFTLTGLTVGLEVG